MAIKRYQTRYVRSYRYTNEDGTEEDIIFQANGYLFPLFKSYAGVELGDALRDYREGLMRVMSKETMAAVAKFEATSDQEEKMRIVTENPEAFLGALREAQDADTVQGLSLTELLLIVMHVCALPQDDRAEALSAGTEILPQACYEDPQLAFDLLGMALQYNETVKKNSSLTRR